MPPSIPVWVNALRSVDTNPMRLISHANRGMLVGYQFPDPNIFLNTNRVDKYIVAWLTMRAGWVNSLLTLGPQPVRNPGPQHWREFLANKVDLINPVEQSSCSVVINMAEAPAPPKKNSATTRRKQKLVKAAEEIFRLRLREKEFPKRVFWQEHAIQDGDLSFLTPTITSEVIWDLFENNFRMELRALERLVMEDEWVDPVRAAVRDDLLRAVFPGDGACLVWALPTRDVGLAAPAWQDRVKYVESFRVLLSAWPGETASRLQSNTVLVLAVNDPMNSSINDEDVLNVERMAVHFYCQMFFDNFGRAAICPHRLPSTSTTSVVPQ